MNKLTPFRTGILAILVSCLVWYGFGYDKPVFFTAIDNRIFDQMFRFRGPRPVSGDVVIIDIDEPSLKTYGQWPWPRDRFARLINRISRGRPRIIGLDIVFAERDQTTPALVLEKYRSRLSGEDDFDRIRQILADPALDHDLILGHEIAHANVVAGYFFILAPDNLKTETEVPFPSISIRLEPGSTDYGGLDLIRAFRPVINISEMATAQSEGFFNVFPDPNGTVRNVPLFILMDGIPYPSLAFEVVRVAEKIDTVTLLASRTLNHTLKGIVMGNRTIRTDARGQLCINHRGPVYSFPYLSAGDIMDGRHLDRLKNKTVLIGSSAATLGDLVATPFSPAVPGVEVQAAVVDNLLKNDAMTSEIRTEIGVTYALLSAGGLILTSLLAFLPPLAGSLGALALLPGICAGNYLLFFKNNQQVGLVYPMICLIGLTLAVTVVNYFSEGRKRQFIRHAFSHYLSPSVINDLIRHPDRLRLSIEKKTVTVFFSDIRDFTALSETLSPRLLGRLLNEYLTVISDIIMAHNGMVDKYIGDAVMAVWGTPLRDDRQAVRAVGAALEITRALTEFNRHWQAHGIDIRTGIGINTGPASAGNFGSRNRFDYTVIGDHVNLAARIEALNKTYGVDVIISEYTFLAVREKFFCRAIDRVKVKGRTEPVNVYEVICEGAPSSEIRQETEQFHTAYGLYLEKKFTSAREHFSQLYDTRPAMLFKLYINRIDRFAVSPPPDNWDGIFEQRRS